MATAEAINGRELVIEGIGPIEHRITIVHPAEGGIIVFRGRNGSGKTKALEAIQALATGKGKLEHNDRVTSGRVSGFGATITVSGSTRRSGEAEVGTIEGRLNISDLIDPGLKDQAAADDRRIKALLGITGQKPDPALFAELVDDRAELEALCRPESLESKDLIQMAARIKDDFERHARTAEGQAATAEGHAKAKREAAEGVKLEAESDGGLLAKALEEAIRAEQKLSSDAQHAEKGKRDADAARDALEDAQAEYSGLSVIDAADQLHACEKQVDEALAAVAAKEEFVRKAQEVLAEKRRELEKQQREAQAARAVLSAAENHARLIAGWKQTIEAPRIAPIHPKALADARCTVTAAREACDQGVRIRDAQAALRAADQFQTEANAHAKRAIRLREAAKGTDDVLSRLVDRCGTGLRVKQGRLILDTPKRGETYFSDLSAGERASQAIGIAVKALPEDRDGVLVCSQEIYEGLDPTNRRKLHAQLIEARAVMHTAEATDDVEMRAEVFQP